MRYRAYVVISILVLCVSALGVESPRRKLSGVYSNGRDGFGASSIFLAEDGHCLFAGGVSGAAGSWGVVKAKGEEFVHLRLADAYRDTEVRETSALLRIDSKGRVLKLVSITNTLEAALSHYDGHRNKERPMRDGNYRFKTNAIPIEITSILSKFPEHLRMAKIRAERIRKSREAEAARLKAEQPRYDACRTKISKDPSIIGSFEIEFLKRDETEHAILVGQAKRTPECRALIDALKDRSIVFPENALMALIEKYPWNRVFFVIGGAFVRDELSAESRRKLHVLMRESHGKLGYDVVGPFYMHPNTPIDLVQEAYAWEGNVLGLVRYLEKRLKKDGVMPPKKRGK